MKKINKFIINFSSQMWNKNKKNYFYNKLLRRYPQPFISYKNNIITYK